MFFIWTCFFGSILIYKGKSNTDKLLDNEDLTYLKLDKAKLNTKRDV